VTPKRFRKIAEQAVAELPSEFRPFLCEIVLAVKARPSRKLLRELDVPDDEDLFGFYDGPALIDRSAADPPGMPSRIVLFYEPLLDACETREELVHEIQTTILHEIGHHFGLDEERLEDLGYG
jgi:predicted Zn-dependent protease with MMP-like domain